MKTIMCVILMLACAPSSAEIYKTVFRGNIADKCDSYIYRLVAAEIRSNCSVIGQEPRYIGTPSCSESGKAESIALKVHRVLKGQPEKFNTHVEVSFACQIPKERLKGIEKSCLLQSLNSGLHFELIRKYTSADIGAGDSADPTCSATHSPSSGRCKELRELLQTEQNRWIQTAQNKAELQKFNRNYEKLCKRESSESGKEEYSQVEP